MENEKVQFLRKLNEAFANSDVEFILDCVTEDINWAIVGDKSIEGKVEFAAALQEMASPEPMVFEIDHIITHGKDAVVDGKISIPDGKAFSFCDIYTFNGFKDPKIKAMRSYVIELK